MHGEPTKNLNWIWNKKHVPLNKLEDNQLYYIRDTLLKESKDKKWFGIPNKVWKSAINDIARQREKQNIDSINNEIIGRRIKKASKIADIIANSIYVAMNKNNYVQTVN